MFSQVRAQPPPQQQQPLYGGPAASPPPQQAPDVLRHVPLTIKGGLPIALQIPQPAVPTFALDRNAMLLHTGERVETEPRLENTLAWCRAQVEARAQHREGCAAAWARLQAEGAARRQGAEAERRAAEEAARRRAEEEARRRAEEEAARKKAEEERRRPWSCNVCTGENAASAAACAVCSCARGTPAPVVKKWTCDMCTWANAYLDEASGNKGACEQCGSRPGAGGGGGGGGGFMRGGGGAWNCRVCSSNNDAGAQRCKVCGAENSV